MHCTASVTETTTSERICSDLALCDKMNKVHQLKNRCWWNMSEEAEGYQPETTLQDV